LYARAIAQGGVAFYPLPSLEEAEAAGDALFKSLSVADLKSAREMPADTLNTAMSKSSQSLAIIDGDLVQRGNLQVFEHGRFNDTPILVGYTSAEWGDPSPPTAAAWLRARIEGLPCKQTHAAIEAAYPFANDDEAKMATRHIFRDLSPGWSTWEWARLQTSRGRNRAYVYFFDVQVPEHPFGAWHAAEYPYVFGNFAKSPTASDEATSAFIRKYWINFATRGDPNGPGLPHWKTFDERSQAAMIFGNSTGSSQLPSIQGIKAWDALGQCAGPEALGRFLFEDVR
jgi:para-nitrobenzyl esterase